MTATSRLHAAINHDITTITQLDLTQLATRLHTLLELDLQHPSTPDGMPTQTIGAAPAVGRSAPLNGDTDGHVALTTVEAAYEARRHHRDEVRRAVTLAITHIGEARRHLQSTVALLDNLDHTRNNHNAPSTEEGCRAIARIPGAWEGIAHRVTINGDTWPLGTWAYGFLTRNERLPTIDECRHHLAGKRIMIKAG